MYLRYRAGSDPWFFVGTVTTTQTALRWQTQLNTNDSSFEYCCSKEKTGHGCGETGQLSKAKHVS